LATEEYAIHQFKDYVAGNSANLIWNGQSNYPCYVTPVYLQIYNRTLMEWETLDSNTTAEANTDFDLTAQLSDLSDYKDAGNVICCRVYQFATD